MNRDEIRKAVEEELRRVAERDAAEKPPRRNKPAIARSISRFSWSFWSATAWFV